MFLMVGGHVDGSGGVAAPLVGAGVGGDAFAFEENLDGGGGDFGVDGFADEAAGDAVIVGVNIDVVVDIDFGPFPFGEFVGAVRQGEGGGRARRRSADGTSGFCGGGGR